MAFVKNHQGKHIRAFKDIGPEMERLRLRVRHRDNYFALITLPGNGKDSNLLDGQGQEFNVADHQCGRRAAVGALKVSEHVPFLGAAASGSRDGASTALYSNYEQLLFVKIQQVLRAHAKTPSRHCRQV